MAAAPGQCPVTGCGPQACLSPCDARTGQLLQVFSRRSRRTWGPKTRVRHRQGESSRVADAKLPEGLLGPGSPACWAGLGRWEHRWVLHNALEGGLQRRKLQRKPQETPNTKMKEAKEKPSKIQWVQSKGKAF